MNNKLITVRKGYPKKVYNIEGNLGGIFSQSPQEFFGSYNLTSPPSQKIDWSNPLQRTKALANTNYLANNFSQEASANNPFAESATNTGSSASKSGIGTLGGQALKIGAGVVSPIVKNVISGGLNSGVGNAVASVGSAVAGAIPDPLLSGVVSLGSNIIGGGINAAIGKKVDAVKKAANDAGDAQLVNLQYSNTLDDIGPIQSVANIQKDTTYGFLRKGKEKRDLNNRLNRRADLMSLAYRNQDNNVDTLLNNQLSSKLATFAAYGGQLNDIDPSSAIGYALYTDKFIKDKYKNDNTTNLFAGIPSTMFGLGGCIPNRFDIGGTLQTKGANYGNMTHINAGGTHEESPYDGVQIGTDQQGTPNLVEENEVIYNDYVYSNRLTVPDFKKQYKNKKEAPYEAQVLWNYSGRTFADAAKKIEKSTGSDERSEDPIAQRGMESMLEVLAGIQEKEREKEKLREQQEAIDNMTPEEFAAMQQQQQLQQQQQAAMQQETEQQAMQQQQGIQGPPSEEELAMMQQQAMQQQMMQQQAMQGQPMAAYGGKLFAYGGSFDEFTNDLKTYGLTIEDVQAYADALYKNNGTPITADNFNQGYKNIAESFLKNAETISKKYTRRAKKQGIKVDELTGGAKAQYDRELAQAIRKGTTDLLYDVSKDTNLSFNSPEIAKAKNKQQVYGDIATYNDLIARGGKPVTLDNQGRPMWESMAGLNKIDNSAEGFYNDITNENAEQKGVYNYVPATASSIANLDNLKLYGWQLGGDNNYAVSHELTSPNTQSQEGGRTVDGSTYSPSDLGDLKYGQEGYKEAVQKIQDDSTYIGQTNYVLDAIKEAGGDFNKLQQKNPDIANYLLYLDKNTGNKEKKLTTTKDGKTILNKDAYNLYKHRRTDDIYGIYHYQFDRSKGATADRYYYEDGDQKVYISNPVEGFSIDRNNPIQTTLGNTTFNDYKVTGLNKNRTLTQVSPNKVVDVSDISDLPNWTKLNKPVLLDNTDNLGYGIKGTTDWVDYNSNPAIAAVKNTNNDPFPVRKTWPETVGLLAQLGSLGYNVLTPADYSNADALIKASASAGAYSPIAFNPIGNYLPYNPMDIWYKQNELNAQTRAADRNVMNTSGGNRGTAMAGILANNYNSQLASGNLYRQALEYNDNLRKSVEEFNRGTNQFNSEGFLKADMANQEAALKARGYSLEGERAGYAMRQALQDAKANSINAGINGLINTAMTSAQNKYNDEVMAWRLKHNPYVIEGYDWDPTSYTYKKKEGAKGGKIRRKRKGLGF